MKFIVKKFLLGLLLLLLPSLTLAQALQVTGTLVVQASNVTVTFPSSFLKVYQNVPYSSLVAVTGGVGPYSCVVTAGALPAGLSMASCLVSGTPTGTATVNPTIQATDSLGQTGSSTISLTTASLSSITVTGSSLVVAPTATQQLTGTGTWSDGTTNDLTIRCAWSSGTPAKATVGAATGIVTGVAAGTSLISCLFNSVTGSATVTVPANPAIATTSLAHAQVTIPYAPVTLQTTGGTPPFTWAVTVGTLPTGITLGAGTGVVSGTPTGTTQTFSVVATDSLSVATAAQSLTLTVETVSSNAAACNPATVVSGSSTPCTSTTTFSGPSTANTTQGSAIQKIATASGGTSDTTHTTVVTTNSLNVAVGDVLFVQGSHGTDTTTTITPTDTAGNTFTAIDVMQSDAGIGAGRDFYSVVTIANAADFITITYNNPVRYDTVEVLQLRGMSATPLDVHAVAVTSNPSACQAGPVTTTFAVEALVIACRPGGFQSFTAAPGYNLDVVDVTTQEAVASQTVSSIQTAISPTLSYNSPQAKNLSFLATFKAASAAMGAAWSSTSNCSVDSSGNVTGRAVGSCTITAIYGGQTGNATVTVNPPAVTSITVAPTSVSGAQGATQQFTATDQAGNVITNNVSWAAALPSCVSINSSTGLATVISASACGATSNITATQGSVSGSATFTGTGTPSTAGLLSGCTVLSGNTINFGVGGCPASLPAGWTQVNAVAFENGTLGTGAFSNGVSIVCNFSHTGSCSINHKVVQGDDTGEWDSANVIGTKEMYLSWWEFDEGNGSFSTDMGLAGVRWPSVGGGANSSFWIDPNQPQGCNGSAYAFSNIKTNRMMLIYGTGGLQSYGYTSNCLAPNSPSWGNWTQWEYRIKINDPTAFPAVSNGEYQLYQNGVLVAGFLAGAGVCNSGGVPCSNMVGTDDYTLYNHRAWIGGTSTYRAQYEDVAKTVCSSGSNPTVRAETLLGPFTSQNLCPLQSPPNGWPMNTVPGGMNRWWDDIIIMKR